MKGRKCAVVRDGMFDENENDFIVDVRDGK